MDKSLDCDVSCSHLRCLDVAVRLWAAYLPIYNMRACRCTYTCCLEWRDAIIQWLTRVYQPALCLRPAEFEAHKVNSSIYEWLTGEATTQKHIHLKGGMCMFQLFHPMLRAIVRLRVHV